MCFVNVIVNCALAEFFIVLELFLTFAPVYNTRSVGVLLNLVHFLSMLVQLILVPFLVNVCAGDSYLHLLLVFDLCNSQCTKLGFNVEMVVYLVSVFCSTECSSMRLYNPRMQ